MSVFDEAGSDLFDAVLYEFGESITYRQISHPDVSCMAVWRDDVPEAAQPGLLSRVDIKDSDLNLTAEPGDTIIRDAVNYRVVEPIVFEYGVWKLQVRK